MSFQTKFQPSNIGRSRTVPLSVFNKQILEEASRVTVSKNHNSSGYSGRSRGDLGKQSSHKRTSVMSSKDPNQTMPHPTNRSTTEQQSSTSDDCQVSHEACYVRPTGRELVSIKYPSCLGLPQGWNSSIDRLIAYLATHAPLDENGKPPGREEKAERWKTVAIAKEVMERFPKLNTHIKPSMIEKRLTHLDEAGDNDYFKVPYGAYSSEEWANGI